MAETNQTDTGAFSREYTGVLAALTQGSKAIRDPFTYRVALIGFIPPMVATLLGYLALRNQLSCLEDPILCFLGGSPLEVIGTGVGWAIFSIVTGLLAYLWASLGIGLRTVHGQAGTTRGIMTAAAQRIPTVLGSWLLIIGVDLGLALVFWLLASLAGVPFLSFAVALLVLPLAIVAAMLTLTTLMAIVFAPALAVADSDATAGMLLKRTAGMLLAYPAGSALLVAAAGAVALMVAAAGAFAFVGPNIGFERMAAAMVGSGQGLSLAVLVIEVTALTVLVGLAPWVLFVASVTSYSHMALDHPELDGIATRLLSIGWERVRQVVRSVAAATMTATNAVRNTVERQALASRGVATAGIAMPAEPGPGPAPSSPPRPPQLPVCAKCGAANPPAFRYCCSCGTPAAR
jgi:hypothetical protein